MVTYVLKFANKPDVLHLTATTTGAAESVTITRMALNVKDERDSYDLVSHLSFSSPGIK